MNKKRMIAITGNIAAGKTGIVKKLAKKLGMGIYLASDDFRRLARKSGLDIASFNESIKGNSEIDRHIDNNIKENLKNMDNIVVDSRLAWHFVKGSYKVFIKVDMDIAADRLVKDAINRGKEEKYLSVKEAKSAIAKRQKYERERYKEEYNVDLLDYSNYDLVLDSSTISENEIVDNIILEYNKWITSKE